MNKSKQDVSQTSLILHEGTVRLPMPWETTKEEAERQNKLAAEMKSIIKTLNDVAINRRN